MSTQPMASSSQDAPATASPPLPCRVYSPESSAGSPLRMLGEMMRDLRASRELAFRLAQRDIKAQYRQTFLGLLWAFILPLANTVTWVFLSQTGLVRVADTGLPYPLYVFTGTMLWAIFMDALSAPLQQVQAAKPMLAKLNFPREALIVSGLYQTLFNGGIKIALVLAVLWSMGYASWSQLLLFPLAVLSLMLAGTAIGLLITPVGVLYGDVGRALPLMMQFLMYATPVVFPMPKEGWAATLIGLNPLTPLIVTAREWLTGADASMLASFLLINAAAAVLLLLVWAVYRLAMPILVERMGG
jgi:lipopolysaccharide transport system permease protein